MSEAAASALLQVASIYLLAGLLFATAFLSVGVGRIDPQAQGASFGFRLVVLPGAVVLWPWLAWRWASGAKQPPDECSPHLRAAARRRP